MKIHNYDDTSRKSLEIPENMKPGKLTHSQYLALHDMSLAGGGRTTISIEDVSPVAAEALHAPLVQTHPLNPAKNIQVHDTQPELSHGSSGARKAFSIPQINEWNNLQPMRNEIWALRSQIQETRKVLREKQEQKSRADDILFQRMSRDILKVPNTATTGQKSLEALMKDCQDARDTYGPLEDDCNRMEDRMSGQEFRLNQLEKQFYSRLSSTEDSSQNQGMNYHVPSTFISPDPTKVLEGSEDESEMDDSEFHPDVGRYLSKQGDLDLLEERLDDLLDEKESLEEEKQSRLRFGLKLDPEDQAWLDNSQAEIAELDEKVQILKIETERLKGICLSQGLVDEDGEPTSFESQERNAFENDLETSPGFRVSEYVKYPFLLPHPATMLDASEVTEPDPKNNTDPTAIAICNWILHQLRSTALDVCLLSAIYEKDFGRTSKSWEAEVLSLWFKDGSIKSIGSFRIQTASYTPEGIIPSQSSSSYKQEPLPNFYYEKIREPPDSKFSKHSIEIEDDDNDIFEISEAFPWTRREIFWNSD